MISEQNYMRIVPSSNKHKYRVLHNTSARLYDGLLGVIFYNWYDSLVKPALKGIISTHFDSIMTSDVLPTLVPSRKSGEVMADAGL